MRRRVCLRKGQEASLGKVRYRASGLVARNDPIGPALTKVWEVAASRGRWKSRLGWASWIKLLRRRSSERESPCWEAALHTRGGASKRGRGEGRSAEGSLGPVRGV